MKIKDFIDNNLFSVSKIINIDNFDITHTIDNKIDGDLDHITEEVYQKLIPYLNKKLKLTTKFFKKDNQAYYKSSVYVSSSKEISQLLDSFNKLTEEQKEKAINYFNK